MNSIEYALKRYLKRLLNETNWLCFMVGVFNMFLLFSLLMAYARHHVDRSPAELAEIEDTLGLVVLVIAAAPFLSVAAGLAIEKVAHRVGYETSDELWPEVKL